MSIASAANPITFWGIHLNSGVRKSNMVGFYLTCYTAIMLATFIPATQPFLLNEVLRVPTAEQGVLSGNLGFWGEIVIILTVGIWGSLSDKLGRKTITVASYLILACGVFLYGISDSPGDLLLARCVFCTGIAGASTMMITLMADYARNHHRGKATGYLGVMNGLGAMTAVLGLVRLPGLFQGQGMNASQASIATFGVVAGLIALTAVLLLLTLRAGLTAEKAEATPLLKQLSDGVASARDPGIALAYASSFVARGNLAVVGTFFTLWASIYGTQELGMTTAEALAKGGGIVAISYAASLFTAPFFGIMTDKLNRVDALAVAMLCGIIGYGSTFFVANPFSLMMIFCLVFIGMAEVGCIITSGVLIAQQAPKKIRGSVIGAFTLTGAIGILVASKLGGVLFDNWMQSGPFVLFGIAAAVILIACIALRKRVLPLNEDTGAQTAV